MRLAWLLRIPAVVLAALLLSAGAYFGSSRDFGLFLLSIPILPLLFLSAVAASAWATSRAVERSRAMVAWALICLTPLAYFSSYGMLQSVRFLLWAPAGRRRAVCMGCHASARMRFGYCLIVALTGVLTTSCAPTYGHSPRAIEEAACMVRAAETVPKVTSATWGFSTVEGEGIGAELFVEYVYSTDTNSEITVRFVQTSDHEFQTTLWGPRTPGSKLPDWGIARVSDLWWSRCRVSVVALLV
jgi:hypothetical protein